MYKVLVVVEVLLWVGVRALAAVALQLSIESLIWVYFKIESLDLMIHQGNSTYSDKAFQEPPDRSQRSGGYTILTDMTARGVRGGAPATSGVTASAA